MQAQPLAHTRTHARTTSCTHHPSLSFFFFYRHTDALEVHFEQIEMLIQPHSARNLRGPLLGTFMLRSHTTLTTTLLNQTRFVVPRGAVAVLNTNADRAELRLEDDPIVMRSWLAVCLAALSVLVVLLTREFVRFAPPPNSNVSGSAGAGALMIVDGELAGTF